MNLTYSFNIKAGRKLLFSSLLQTLKFWLLPLLAAIFPAFFHYANNASILLLPSLTNMLIAGVLLSIAIFFVMLVIIKRPAESANASFIFLIFFNTYGVIYDLLMKWDFFQVEHFALLPLFLLVAVYCCWFMARLAPAQSNQVWTSLLLIVGVLLIFNLIRIVPAELQKRASLSAESQPAASAPKAATGDPDIYFIIMDEFSGFEPMRQYWHNPQVDGFVQALKSRGFTIIEQSHSSSINTLHQMSERLNYEQVPTEAPHSFYFKKIADNNVMRYLKARGYTTVVMEELSEPSAYRSMNPIIADYTFESTYVPDSLMGSFFDDFGTMLADDSMLRAFSKYYQSDASSVEPHIQMLNYAVDKIGNLGEVPTPKFVYLHLLFPHKPFIYDENGQPIPLKFRSNWYYYLGQYNYSMKVALKMVDSIMADSDPQRPPVIILQSDHGARNLKNAPTTVILDNFPEEFKHNIMFALYLPGYDTSTIPQDIKPINTFPLVFNHLFDDNIPLK